MIKESSTKWNLVIAKHNKEIQLMDNEIQKIQAKFPELDQYVDIN